MEKRKYTYVWISLVVLVFGIIFIPEIIKRIKSDSVVVNDRMSSGNSGGALSYIILNGEKRMVPSFALLDQDSLLITNEDYKGKVFVVEFFFTSCPTICPLMTKNLVHLQETFKSAEGFGIASISINPRTDSPSVLKEYAAKYGIANLDWHLLTGDGDQIYSLANSGFNMYASEAPNVAGGFEHSGLFALVDRQGYLRSRNDKFGNPLIYYRGTISEEQGTNGQGEKEQISLLKEDITKLLLE